MLKIEPIGFHQKMGINVTTKLLSRNLDILKIANSVKIFHKYISKFSVIILEISKTESRYAYQRTLSGVQYFELIHISRKIAEMC